MLRFSSLVLTSTMFCVAVTTGLQGQAPEGGAGRQGEAGQHHGQEQDAGERGPDGQPMGWRPCVRRGPVH